MEKDYPTEADDNKRINMTERGYFLKHLAQKRLFDNKEHPKINAPKNIIPIGAVPKAGQEPNDHDVSDLFHQASAAAAQAGDVVLMSPASAAFDQFKNFAVRGAFFKKIVMEL